MLGNLNFFFQAEDGIRAPLVTGVQTCALPIWAAYRSAVTPLSTRPRESPASSSSRFAEIGRASCRERVWVSVVAVSAKKMRRFVMTLLFVLARIDLSRLDVAGDAPITTVTVPL